jgi:hypothetical protein
MLQDLLGRAIVKTGIIDCVESIHPRREMQRRDLWFLRYENILGRVSGWTFGDDLEMAASGAGCEQEGYTNRPKNVLKRQHLSHDRPVWPVGRRNASERAAGLSDSVEPKLRERPASPTPATGCECARWAIVAGVADPGGVDYFSLRTLLIDVGSSRRIHSTIESGRLPFLIRSS